MGSILYAQLCNKRGGIEADLTITRIASDRFYIVTGSGFGTRDSDWIQRHIGSDKQAYLSDVTSAFAVIALCGPKARDVLGLCSENDVSNSAFAYATQQDITIGAAPVRALRIGFVGELGWELHVPTEFAQYTYETLWEAGQAYDIRNVGYRAIDTLRLEKGYVYWSSDVTPDYTPYEAGLGFRVHLDTGGDFLGRDALTAQDRHKPPRRLCTFICDEKLALHGGETLLKDGKTVSLITSQGYGHTIGKMIMRAYLPQTLYHQRDFAIEVFGEHHPIIRVDGPLYDAKNERLKG